MVMRTFTYKLEVICAGNGTIDEAQVEQMLDLAFQDLVYDDEFIAALDEKESVTIRVSKLDNRMVDSKGS
jgi:hypothetical protein